MLNQTAVGLSTAQTFHYTWRDVILYNLSVGAQQEELEYVYEKGLKAVPTFGVIPCLATFGTTDPHTDQPYMPTRGTTIKHLAANNQESNRTSHNSNVSERTMRELYLKGFELTVKYSDPLAIMTSLNCVNGPHGTNSREGRAMRLSSGQSLRRLRRRLSFHRSDTPLSNRG